MKTKKQTSKEFKKNKKTIEEYNPFGKTFYSEIRSWVKRPKNSK